MTTRPPQPTVPSDNPNAFEQIQINFGRALASMRGTSAAGVGAPTSANDPLLAPVWMGQSTRSVGPDRFQGKPVPGAEGGLKTPTNLTQSVDDVTTVGDAYDRFHRMSNKERRAFAKKLENLGVIEPGSYSYGDLASLWREAVDEASDIHRASGRKVSPTGYLDLMKQMGMGAGSEEFDGRDVSTGTQTQTDFSTKAEARAALRTAFQSELGRDPTRKETRVFYRALHAKEAGNPTTTTSRSVTTRKRNGNSNTNSSSTTTGGVGEEFIHNYMDDRFDTEQDARATATDYYGALLDLAGGGS